MQTYPLERHDEILLPHVDAYMETLWKTTVNQSEAHFIKQAQIAGVPSVRPDVARFLTFMTAALRPKRILEIGTGAGYSTYAMLQGAGSSLETLLSIESNPQRFALAQTLLHGTPHSEKLDLRCGKALDVIATLNGDPFDFVFIDAIKRDYPRYFHVLPCTPHAVIVFDNMLFRGMVAKEKAELPTRYHQGVSEIAEFTQFLTHHAAYTTTLLPIGDGMILARRREL
ncbi:O-methyltransferase [Chrysiogenes arsenatis]|uniref:O-methyltransferase n=1 Tax=Chrysiogenes arsenatis TaxID=309797 RepID=UPI0003FFAA61|nr:O-methyltransferase [Chrysiogenes arsenatis]